MRPSPQARQPGRSLCAALAAAWLGLTGLPAQAQTVSELVWVSEEYAPFNYTDQGVPTGISVEVLQHIWTRLGVNKQPSDIQMLPWARGYRMAQEQAGVCLFSTTVTEPRKALFHFVSPIIATRIAIVAPRERQLKIDTVADLAPYTIGVVREDIGEQALLNDGSTATLSRADSARSLVRMLAGGRFDAISYESNTVRWNMQESGIDTTAFEDVFTVRESVLGIACHKDTAPDTLAQLQHALDALHADGTLKRISAAYLK